MENKCQFCRYCSNGYCYNRDFNNMIDCASIEDKFTSISENGEVEAYIKESCTDDIYELANVTLEKLTELDYIKKNKKKINNIEEVDKDEQIIHEVAEIMDSIISGYVYKVIDNIDMQHKVNSQFCCKFYE